MNTMLLSSLSTVGSILAAMVLVAVIESIVPLHARGACHRRHLAPNLALTFITFATNIVFNAALVTVLVHLESTGFGLLRWSGLPAPVTAVAAVVLLDFSFYVAHRAMHDV